MQVLLREKGRGPDDDLDSISARDLTAIDTPKAGLQPYIPATTYFVNAEPASLSEAGPSAT